MPGPAGPLEALLRPVAGPGPPRRAALLCHPHPEHGGSLHNKILYRIAKRLPLEAATAALRFNFRGVGESAGRFDGGRGEAADAQAALDWLAARHPGLPLAVVGYSFGAAVGLRAAATDARVEVLVGLGLPLRLGFDLEWIHRLRKPLLLVHGERDEFAGADAMEAFVAGLDQAVDLHLVPGADHLFSGQENRAVDAVVSYLGAA